MTIMRKITSQVQRYGGDRREFHVELIICNVLKVFVSFLKLLITRVTNESVYRERWSRSEVIFSTPSRNIRFTGLKFPFLTNFKNIQRQLPRKVLRRGGRRGTQIENFPIFLESLQKKTKNLCDCLYVLVET